MSGFKFLVDASLKQLERILAVHRDPRLAHDVDHEYDDKYLLVEQMTNTALIGLFNILSQFGLSAIVLSSIDKSKLTTIRFQASQSCTFVKQSTVAIPLRTSTTKHEEEQQSQRQTSRQSFVETVVTSITRHIVDHVPAYHWNVSNNWEISIISGPDIEGRKVLKQRSSTMELMIESDNNPPLPEYHQITPCDVSLSGILALIDTETMTSIFAIHRHTPTTRTPCRNEPIDLFLNTMNDLCEWALSVQMFFETNVTQAMLQRHSPAGPPVVPNPNEKLPFNPSDIFLPVLPLMERSDGTTEEDLVDPSTQSVLELPSLTLMDNASASSPILSTNDIYKVLNHHVHSIKEYIGTLQKIFPSPASTALMSVEEASIAGLCDHTRQLYQYFVLSVNYVEDMLRNQLVAAIGKTIQSSDIDQFMRYHNARLLNPAPMAFCHSIRQPNHDPVGLLSIEGREADGSKVPIQTLSRKVNLSTATRVPINSQTTLQLTGQTYLHGWIRHRFGCDHKSFELVARARQFSVFLLVVGTISGSDTLDPKDAIIIQDKDEVLIPLLLEEIPTSKEFKDAIRSLSPEQQRFATAFRSMQLGSSVLGICVIQVKPQLEVLLGVGQGGLTKEMKLTQDLMELFIEYQVPSDLVCYDGIDPQASIKEKVENVRSHVHAVLDVIKEQKEQQFLSTHQKRICGRDSIHDEPLYKWHVDRPAHHDRFCCDYVPDYNWTSDKPEDSLWKKDEPDGQFWKKDQPDDCHWKKDQPDEPLGETHEPIYDWSGSRPNNSNDRPRDMVAPELSLPKGALELLPLDQASNRVPSQNLDNQSTSGSEAPREDSLTLPSFKPVEGAQGNNSSIDFTALPQLLNSTIEAVAGGVALRSTTIKLGDTWQRNRQENLFSKPQNSFLTASEAIKTERNKAFDLLDALSRSGALPVAFSELHVIVAVTHAFENDLLDTIIQDNINPIEKLEMSSLVVGSAIHGVPAAALVREDSQWHRLATRYPSLLRLSQQS